MSGFYKILLGLMLLQCNLAFSQGKIIMNGATMNVVNAAYVVTKDVSLTSASSLNVNSSTIKIAGAITNNSGNFDVTSGTVDMNGSSLQLIPVNAFATNKILNLIISNNVVLGGEDSLTGVLFFGGSNKDFTTNGFLTLKSTSQYTANVADITNAGSASGNTVSGNVKVERFIPAHRAWRLLTSPTNVAGGQTINAAWQEGVDPLTLNDPDAINNPFAGFGVQITGGLAADGFDQGVNTNPGIKKFQNGAWTALANTNATIISSQPGYMLFVRGDRSTDLSQGIYAATSNTVLRSTGTLKTGNQSYATNATGFTLIGNPYASRINFRNVTKGSAPDIYYLWDPSLTGTNGVGGYITFTRNGSSYTPSPMPTSPFDLNGGIESGSAFLVNNTSGSTITIKETDKSFGSANVYRPLALAGQIRTNLYAYNNDGTRSLQDGNLILYSNNFSNAVDKEDAWKMTNISENLGIKSGATILSIEKRQSLSAVDSIVYNMTTMKVKSYQFEFIAQDLNAEGLTGYLEDSYFNTSTPIDLNGTTTFNFNVVNVPGSWNPNRFHIVFKQLSVLPVTFSTIKAVRQNDDILVDWKVENEMNIKQYEVERSADGREFKRSDVVTATGKNNSSGYNWLDQNPISGNNFYRIKSIGINGEEKYSSIVKVSLENNLHDIVIYPNPVTNDVVSLQFNNMPAGNYQVNLVNNLGQVLLVKQITHASQNSTETFELNSNVAKGIYNLNVVKPDNGVLSIKMFYK
jgi:hypothetical protein